MKRAVLALTLLSSQAFAQDFGVRNGDRVVFYGDSITEDGRYTQAVEMFVATRFPDWSVTFQNSGVGGDKVSGGWAGGIDARLDRDVIAHKPTVVTIMLGMNDGGYKAFDQATFDAYASGYRHIVSRLKEALPGVRLTLLQPSAYDDVSRPPGFPEGYNGVLKKYGALVQEVARDQGAVVVDLNAPLVAGIEKVSKTNPALARQIIPDRVHPGASGHFVMAGAILRAWNAPTVVSRVEMEATANNLRLVRADNTEVTRLSVKGPYLEWTQTDAALPLPLSFKDGEVELGEVAGAGLEAFNQQVLKITGLFAGRYEVLVDGASVGHFTHAELATGVNFAKEDTAMYRQALPVRWTTGDRHELELARRRLLAAAGDDPTMAPAAIALATLDAKMQQDRRGTAKPSAHRYEVRRPFSLK
jgi:lysophospholipase L1-like esterase